MSWYTETKHVHFNIIDRICSKTCPLLHCRYYHQNHFWFYIFNIFLKDGIEFSGTPCTTKCSLSRKIASFVITLSKFISLRSISFFSLKSLSVKSWFVFLLSSKSDLSISITACGSWSVWSSEIWKLLFDHSELCRSKNGTVYTY